jgi:hypothetical protein
VSTAQTHTAPTASPFMARIDPKRPKNAPTRLTLPWLEGHGQRFFDAELGFIPVNSIVAEILKKVHVDGVMTEQGGEGAFLFEVVTAEHARKIVAIEERRALLSASKGNAGLKGVGAGDGGEWSEDDLANLGVQKPAMSALDVLAATRAEVEAKSAVSGSTPSSETATPTAPTAAGRVGRRPAKGKAPPPGSGT